MFSSNSRQTPKFFCQAESSGVPDEHILTDTSLVKFLLEA